MISHDTTPNVDGGHSGEVAYKIVNGEVTACVDTDIASNNIYEVVNAQINDPAFLDNLAKVMEKIFGEGALSPKTAT